MKLMDKFVKRFRELPTNYLFAHVAAKFIFGLGLGILVARYVGCTPIGFLLVLLAIVLSLPGAYAILTGK